MMAHAAGGSAITQAVPVLTSDEFSALFGVQSAAGELSESQVEALADILRSGGLK